MIKKVDKKRIKQKMDEVKKIPCILCGKKASVAGQFIPNDPTRFGANKDKMRIIFFSLCDKCQMDPKTQKNVEFLMMLKYYKVSGSA